MQRGNTNNTAECDNQKNKRAAYLLLHRLFPGSPNSTKFTLAGGVFTAPVLNIRALAQMSMRLSSRLICACWMRNTPSTAYVLSYSASSPDIFTLTRLPEGSTRRRFLYGSPFLSFSAFYETCTIVSCMLILEWSTLLFSALTAVNDSFCWLIYFGAFLTSKSIEIVAKS